LTKEEERKRRNVSGKCHTQRPEVSSRLVHVARDIVSLLWASWTTHALLDLLAFSRLEKRAQRHVYKTNFTIILFRSGF